MPKLDKNDSPSCTAKGTEASNSNLFSDAFDKGITTAVKEHKLEAAAVGTAAIAGAAVVLSRGRVLGGLVRDGVELEAGHVAKPSAEMLASARSSMHGMAIRGEAATESNTFTRATTPPKTKNLDAEKVSAKDSISGNSAKATNDSAKIWDDIEKRLGAQGAIKPASHAKGTMDFFAAHESSNYKFVPVRDLTSSIRLAKGPQMTTVKGQSELVFGKDNSLQAIHFNSSATDEEKAALILKGSYANLIHRDALAAEAASRIEGQSIGFISYPIERIATPAQMHQNAIEGARAYVEMDAGAANKYTAFLTERYGPMTAESQAWGKKIVTDTSAQESGLNHLSAPAKDKLVSSGIPIDTVNALNGAKATVLSPELIKTIGSRLKT